MKNVQYIFGTSASAAARLEAIAKVFNPLAADLISRFVPTPPKVAVDLGCGPGFTTDMLACATGCARTYGLDNSQEFLDAAGQRFGHYAFLHHDVTHVPFPITADVMYARFLLCHLPDPLDVIAMWVTQLNPNGLLFIDEADAIDTDLPMFKTYLDMGQGIIASQGGFLYIGAALASAQYDADVLLNEPTILPVPNWQAATWFYPNTQTIWNESRYVLDHLTSDRRKAIADELAQLIAQRNARSNITWRLRRLVLRKCIT